MQRRPDNSLRGRIARARARINRRGAPGRTVPHRPPVRKRRVPRREIEARRQQMVRWGVAGAGIVVLALLVGGILFDRVIRPNQTLATIGPASISRQDYWKVRANDLYEQARQYQDFAQFVGADQQGQYLSLAQQSLAQIPRVWGSGDVDRATLERMIDNQVYLQGLDDLGLAVTPEEIETFALNRFAPPDAPLAAPSPTPTFTAERAAMATSTAAAFLATPLAGTPAATPLATPVAPQATPRATPVAEAPTAAPATPNPGEARATAEAGFAQFERELFPLARLSREEYERLVAAPALARQKVRDALGATVGQSAPQVRAAHILLPSQEEAAAARARIVDGGEDFAAVAKELSTDEGTAANGGDLGWFTREEMVPPFAAAAFALAPGVVSEPVPSEFGWHLIRVEETDPDRPLTDQQIDSVRQAVVARWLEDQRAALAIRSDLAPSPTPLSQRFVPPAGAPPPPAPTPLPPVASPAGSPEPILVPATPEG